MTAKDIDELALQLDIVARRFAIRRDYENATTVDNTRALLLHNARWLDDAALVAHTPTRHTASMPGAAEEARADAQFAAELRAADAHVAELIARAGSLPSVTP